jgi:hypothetical protein
VTVDLAEFKALSGKSNKARCPVAVVLADFSDCETLQAALQSDEGEITHAGVSRWLGRREVQVSWQAIRNHRNGSCACKHEQA